MSSSSPNGGPARAHPRRAPQNTWQPGHGIVFTASPQPASGTSFSSSTSSSSSASSPSPSQQYGTYSPQQPIVFSRQSSLSFGQAPSYDYAPSFGQAPTFGQAPSFRSFGQQRSFDSTPVFGQRSFERTPSSELSSSFGNTPSRQETPAFGPTSTFEQTSTFERATSFTLSQSHVFGQSSQTTSTSFGQSSSQPSASPPGLSSSQSFGQPSAWQTFSSQPARPTFVFSSQNKTRLVHSSSNQQSSPSPLQSHPQSPVTSEAGQENTAAVDNKTEEAGKAAATTEVAEKAETEEAAHKDDAEAEDQPPVSDLEFNMTKALFDKARNAAPGTPESYWSYTLYRRNPAPVEATGDDSGNASDAESVTSNANSVYSSVTKSGEESERIKVHYCKSKETTERVCAEHFANEPMLGFDLEWMANAARWDGPRKNVCLLQLSSPSRIGLFHLSLFPTQDFITPTLRKILESPDIIKTGVFIKGDATRLLNHLSVNMRGLMELSHLHRLVKYSKTGEYHLVNKRLVSLADQVRENFKLPMFKGQDVRAGNWSRPLQMDQIIYSASDAYASVQLFAILEKKRLSLDPVPPRPAFAELNKPIKLADGVGVTPSTDDATDDAEQPVQDGESRDKAVPLTSGIIADAEGSLLVENETNGASSQRTVSPTSTKRKSISADGQDNKKNPRAPAVPSAFTDARLIAAHKWMGQYRETKTTPVKAGTAALRAYHLWHSNTDLDAEAIAAMLRNPPLKINTVVNYVLSSIQLEKLPYDKDRCRADLMEKLPHKIRLSTYRGLAKACNYNLTASDPASTQA